MVDFAKSIFGFGFNKQQQQQQAQAPTPEQSQQYQQQYQHQQAADLQPTLSATNGANGFFNLQQTSHPTTAISDNSFAYGTTTKATTNFQPEQVLSQVANTTTTLKHQQVFPQQTQHQQPKNHFYQPPPPQQQHHAHYEIPRSSTPSSAASYDTPRGKLRVTIIEARNLITKTSSAQPYVVCTFESSEFITHGPESVSNKPMSLSRRELKPIPTSAAKRPLYSRQSSSQHLNRRNNNTSNNHNNNSANSNGGRHVRIAEDESSQMMNNSNPAWHHETIFDVLGSHSELDISVYDSDETFLGRVALRPSTTANNSNVEWFELDNLLANNDLKGEIKVSWEFSTTQKKHYGPEDFEVLRLLGKGTFGQVFQVRKLDTDRIYAMKVLSKKVIVKKKEVAHTIGERNILVRTAGASSPFIVGLKFSFQTPTDLYLVTDYMSGGELFWHLQKEGKFNEERAKFYIAELVVSLEHLHDNGIIYRDLKPENILLDANGHIALCDFGLSKANLSTGDTTNTFCGTTEYLAPEVLLDESGYTKMVDFWSLGVLIFEMCCGWSPFYAENTQQMYKNIAFGKVRFPKEVLSAEGRSFVKGLLNRNPKHRLGSENDARELKEHPFFADIDWNLLTAKKIPPPFKPHLSSETDTSNFDPEFTNASASLLTKQFQVPSTPLSPGIQANFKGFTFVDESTMEDFHKNRVQQPFGSLIVANTHLPADEDVIEEDEDEDMMMDNDGDEEMDDDQFVNGQFDL
ncbi:hypothetical protein WICPIJ_003793 [Wickerhamomyces pijperi]|uniref:Serine/threonine-protein kinase SCH9 n=1 Tax=Wickerhamomyces pijperi TaxID=599730 RepID=A0A9P8TNJ8_WICPI|nr:hypothetical protein WICPIJ_003793 [Wickerhamomyces pijperi]